MAELFVFFLGVGAAARLTRLVCADLVMGWLRAIVLRRFGAESLPGEFIRCRWCVGMWISLPVAIAAAAVPGTSLHTLPHVFVIPALTLTYSYTTGLLTRLEP